jgi:hypothetical protein
MVIYVFAQSLLRYTRKRGLDRETNKELLLLVRNMLIISYIT